MAKKKKKKKIRTSHICLICIFSLLITFIISMIWLFNKYNCVPDTLIYSVFGLFTGELGFMSIIKSIKIKNGEMFLNEDSD